LDILEVEHLSTPKLTREEAEALTEAIRRALDDGDEMCLELLAGGVPPSKVAAVVLESWGRFREEFTAPKSLTLCGRK
jgi:hypothetical protein